MERPWREPDNFANLYRYISKFVSDCAFLQLILSPHSCSRCKRHLSKLGPLTLFRSPARHRIDEQSLGILTAITTRHLTAYSSCLTRLYCQILCSSTCARSSIGNPPQGTSEPFHQHPSLVVPSFRLARETYQPCRLTTLPKRANPLTELPLSHFCAARSSCGRVSSLMAQSRVFSIMALRLSSLRVRLSRSGVITSFALRR